MENKIKIIILAAGHGTRMKSEIPKVLTPLHGKPLVAHVIEAAKQSGIDSKPVIVVGQQKALIMEKLGQSYEYIVQDEQKGTGHAVMAAQKALEHKADHIVVLYGDHPLVSAETINKLVKKHLDSSAQVTLATVKLANFEGWHSIFYANFSRIIRSPGGDIIKDVQFKDASEAEKGVTEVNPCYYCFEAKWLWEKLKTLETNNAQKEYYLTDLIKIAVKEKVKLESISIDAREALGVNSKEELDMLEKLVV